MAQMSFGRHLLALGEHIDVGRDLVGGSPLVTIICGLVTMMILVIAILACIGCKESKNKEASGEPMLTEVTPIADRRIQPTSPIEDITIQVEVEGNRQSNGSVVKDTDSNGRPKSHDHRALPEIPAYSQASVSQTEDEDDDEGHYDVIVRRQRHTSGSSRTTPVTTPARQPGNNLYEKVDDVNSSYTGVKHEHVDSGYAGMKNPYATVDGIGSADYAHIDEKKTSRHSKDLQRVQTLGMAPQASVETLDDTSYSSVSGPPVPEKNFDLNDENLTITSTPAPSNSPSLPPRNGTNGSASNDGVTLVQADGNTILTNHNGASVVMVTQDVLSVSNSTLDPPKREPPYSSVTARESLANIRDRQAQERRAAAAGAAAAADATYESVNYDQIKSPNGGASGAPTSYTDRQSFTSDLYAEITSGENSTRSSTYARMGDINRDHNAPTPPPLDLLMKLSTHEDEADPGYSMIRRPRPQSAYTLTSPGATGPVGNDQQGALYAVVDKSRKQRASVHVSSGVGGSAQANIDVNQLYAQVNKPSLQKFENPLIPPAYIGTGARPKVLQHNGAAVGTYASNGVEASTSKTSDPGYQTIGSVGKDDPNYDNIPENKLSDIGSDYDPNYERVRIGEVGAQNANVTRVSVPGIATEIDPASNPHGMVHISDHQPQPNFWHKKEHVYEEISEAQREKERLEQLAQYGERTSTAL